MAREVNALNFDVRPREGSCFTISGEASIDTDNPTPGTLIFNTTNAAGKWIDLLVEGFYPHWDRIVTTGPLQDGDTSSDTRQLRAYTTAGNTGWTIKFTRWAPGAFGIPGNGGGEAYVTLPNVGDVTINITVTS